MNSIITVNHKRYTLKYNEFKIIFNGVFNVKDNIFEYINDYYDNSKDNITLSNNYRDDILGFIDDRIIGKDFKLFYEDYKESNVKFSKVKKISTERDFSTTTTITTSIIN